MELQEKQKHFESSNWMSALLWKIICYFVSTKPMRKALYWLAVQVDLMIFSVTFASPVTTLNKMMVMRRSITWLKYRSKIFPQILYICATAFLGVKLLIMWIHPNWTEMLKLKLVCSHWFCQTEMWTASPCHVFVLFTYHDYLLWCSCYKLCTCRGAVSLVHSELL